VTADQDRAASALKAALIRAPLATLADTFAAIGAAHAANLEDGGSLWVLRCSADIAQAHRFPGMRVEVDGAWLRGRWELRDGRGQVIVYSAGDR
jgi:hypothetical protein